ncbi:hypothetical protein ACFOYW_18000 [Gryllotalpicola reticulitermitis]|uniref:Amine oxidase n=1 Tax=Gryllotalpicola reticulitermitis TaxID=1184153 RepID=A0ABV8QBE6_9MICO
MPCRPSSQGCCEAAAILRDELEQRVGLGKALRGQREGDAGDEGAVVAADRNLDGDDIVLWTTFGLTHFPRPEDWPVMPTDYVKFTMKPYGFFDRNPALNIKATESDHCGPAHAGHSANAGHAGHVAHDGHDHQH